MIDNNNQTMEKSKSGRLSVASTNKKIDRHTIRFDHPLQRESDLWPPVMKGNLISDISQGNPIPPLVFAEQVVNGVAIIWDLDGKQRCTNIYSFVHDGYRISKNIRRWLITYQVSDKDEKGNDIFDEKGFPIYRVHTCDIRGKRFSELPDEIQEKILDYNFEIIQYINCSSEDIAYHIARYNEGRPMSSSQKGITRLSEKFAAMVKSISNMEFFKDRGGYKVSEVKNGTIQRVIIESVMAIHYLEDWKKRQEDMCGYLTEHANESDFDDFEEMVQRLDSAIPDEAADLFDSKDSFLWFWLFARFSETGQDGRRFADFMLEFSKTLHRKKLGGTSFDDLNGKSTKDKRIVISKVRHLEKLMMGFLGTGNPEEGDSEIKKSEPGNLGIKKSELGNLKTVDSELENSGIVDSPILKSELENSRVADIENVKSEPENLRIVDSGILESELEYSMIADPEIVKSDLLNSMIADSEIENSELLNSMIADSGLDGSETGDLRDKKFDSVDGEIETERFIAENVAVDLTELHSDLGFYNQSLDDLLEGTVRDDSELRNPENRLSLLAMMVYSYRADQDLDEWMKEFAGRNNTFLADQKENYLYMKHDLIDFLKGLEGKKKG